MWSSSFDKWYIEIASCADDTTPYDCGENMSSIKESLVKAFELLFQWFTDNHMKANEGKCHVLLSANEKVFVNIGKGQIQNSTCEELIRKLISN